MKKLLLLLVLLTLPTFAQSIFPVTANRIIRGSGAPSAGTCASAAAVGKVYIRSDAAAANSSLYVCANTASMTYGWEVVGGGSGGSPGGSSGQVQFNNGAGGFGADSGLAYNSATKSLGVIGTIVTGQNGTAQGKVTFNGATSGSSSISVATTGGTLNLGSTNATIDTSGNLVVVGCTGCGSGTGTVTVVGAGSLTSTAFMTGGGSQASQTPSATSTLDASGNASFAGTVTGSGGFLSGGSPPSVTVGTGGVPYACSEGTVPSVGAAAGVDIVYCDSTLHQPLISVNNGPYIPTVATTTITTGTTATLSTPFTVNEEATAGTGVTYTLPTAAIGLQFCVDNGYNGSAANTGVLTFATSAAGQFMVFTDGTLTATGGNVTSGGAARDGACVYGIDSTHWMFLPHSGTWTKH